MPVEHGGLDVYLATAHLSGDWDSDNLKYRLRFMLACGPEMLNGGDRQYQANLKQCMVTLSTDKCTPDFFDVYECTLSADDFSIIVTSTDSIERSRIQGGQFGAGITVAKPGWMSRIIGKLRFWASRTDESRVKFNRNTKSEEVVAIISYRGNYWAVGDDIRGDPRRGGWLRGQYFQEQPTKPLCFVDSRDRNAEAKVRIDVWAQRGQIVLHEMDGDGQLKREARSRRGNEALQLLEVRARLRGMAITKARPAAFSVRLPLIDAKLPGEPIRLYCVSHPVQPPPRRRH